MYEVGAELVEAREEAELAKLHAELAAQQEASARRSLAAAQAALASALAGPEGEDGDAGMPDQAPPGSGHMSVGCRAVDWLSLTLQPLHTELSILKPKQWIQCQRMGLEGCLHARSEGCMGGIAR